MYFPCHLYQRQVCARHNSQPILNAACKEDCGRLCTDWSAIGLDVFDYDLETQQSLYSIVPNFQVGSVLDLPFADKAFNTVILGEIIEHEAAPQLLRTLQEARRVLTDTGVIGITFPQDKRPPEAQRPKHELFEYCEGIASWHRFVSDEEIAELIKESGLKVVEKERLRYVVCDWQGIECWGYGMQLQKETP